MTTEPTQATGEQSPSVSPLKVLLVADDEFRGSEFKSELASHIDGRSAEVELFVIAPALADSGLEHELASFDGPIKEATVRLEAIIRELKGVGLDAVGEVGDGDPVVAIGDGLREFDADEIIVVAHAGKDRKYAEKDLWAKIEHEFHPPVVELVVGRTGNGDGAPAVLDVQRDGGRAVTEEEEIDATRNFPPLRPRDIAGMLVGFFGTIALGLIAVATGIDDNGDISGGAALVLLLAMGAFLINVAHIVGLLFFQSVRYTGIWEKFMARLSLGYTIVAVVIALIVWLA